MQDEVLNRLRNQINYTQKLYSIEQKRGVNAITNLRQEITLGEKNLAYSRKELEFMYKELEARRVQLKEYKAETEDSKELQADILRTEQAIRTLEDAIRDKGQANALAIMQLAELRRQLQEMLSPLEQMKAGVRKLQVQWENTANDFEGLSVRMGQSFENNMSSAIADWVDGTKNAKDAFRDFAETFLREINRMIIQMIVAKALAVALGIATSAGYSGVGTHGVETSAATHWSAGGLRHARGGILPHIKGFRSMSRGGVTGGPTVAFLGDNKSGRELVIP
ncbi:MAG: hypothetical protein GWN64_16935, partial [Candidatus Thorarchaeota archaeon]|nr:hypothetical protein [Candidatus Thorarchaeota archaeon]